LAAPAVVIHVLPPFYPHAAAGDGPLPRAAQNVLAREGLPLRPFYPHISDASYLAWRGEPTAVLRRHLAARAARRPRGPCPPTCPPWGATTRSPRRPRGRWTSTSSTWGRGGATRTADTSASTHPTRSARCRASSPPSCGRRWASSWCGSFRTSARRRNPAA